MTTTAQSFDAPSPSPSHLPDGTPDWESLRAQFPATESTVYLDIARKALLPLCAADAAAEWFADIGTRATGRRAFSMDAVEETRRMVGETFGATPETLALVKNTSEAINIVAHRRSHDRPLCRIGDDEAGRRIVVTLVRCRQALFKAARGRFLSTWAI